eukprot:GEMP01052362.1.p3 GENE.GEMP01052362.1~~GEMP01052362.1.p3  ORF type:complete len:101 (+),score=28.70 GEMP01052362.1:458-760(+)
MAEIPPFPASTQKTTWVTFPRYKGGGLLWASYGPTLVLEDHTQRVLGNFVTPAQGSLLAGVSGALFVATWVETYIDITALDAPDETFFHVAAKYNPVVYV